MARFVMANLFHPLPCLGDYARRLLHVPHAPARRLIPLTLPFYAETSHWCYGHGPYAPASGQSLCSSLCFVCRDISLVLWARAICPLLPASASLPHSLHLALLLRSMPGFLAASACGALCPMRLRPGPTSSLSLSAHLLLSGTCRDS